jgi:hypothetical protein
MERFDLTIGAIHELVRIGERLPSPHCIFNCVSRESYYALADGTARRNPSAMKTPPVT